MKIGEIKEMPTVIHDDHESLYRSYQTLEKVKEMIKQKTPHELMIEVIELIEENPNH